MIVHETASTKGGSHCAAPSIGIGFMTLESDRGVSGDLMIFGAIDKAKYALIDLITMN